MLHTNATHSPALAAALAEIDRTFGPGMAAEMLKRRCRMALRGGTQHPSVRARYQGRALMLIDRILPWEQTNAFAAVCAGMPPGPTPALRIAINMVAEWRATERGDGLNRMVLEELALILRWMRRYSTSEEFGRIVGEIAQP